MVIDFHTHTFPDEISKKVTTHLGRNVAHIRPFTDGSLSGLLSSMRRSGVTYSVNLPVMTTPGQVEKINHKFVSMNDELFSQGIISFGGMHPDYEDYKKELRYLKDHGIKGIKLHPAYQNVDLDDIRMQRIIGCASELGLITVIHAGMDIGIFDHNYSSVDHILKILKDVAPEKFVLAHMGNWDRWEEVELYLAGAPVWLDTAFSLGPITEHPDSVDLPYINYNLSNEDFIRLVKKHGPDRVLFATDSPWMDQGDYIRRMDIMPLNGEEKRMIMSENALSLLEM